MKAYTWLVLIIFLAVCVPFALGQTTVGSVYGTIADATGATVPGASVTLQDVHTGLTQRTLANGKGEYVFANVNPSDYLITSSAQGFKSETQTGVIVAANQNVHVEFALAVGAVNETVQVQAGVTLVDTREAQIGDTVDEAKVENLPSLNRDVYSLLTTIPGVSAYNADIEISSRNGATFNVNGLPSDEESFYLDGAWDNVFKANAGNRLPNPDALQEVRVLTSNFDAEFGRAPAAVVSAITKSGTEQYHGVVYDYIRNNILNARNYFVAPTSPTNPAVQLQQNQFGATLGGPAHLLPRTFFFVSYEGLIVRSQAVINAGAIQTLTAAERAGNFSQDAATGSFGATGTFKLPKLPTGGNCGTATAPIICNGTNYTGGTLGSVKNFLDPVAQAALGFMPVGSDPVTGSFDHISGQQTAPADSSANEGLARLDYDGFTNHLIEAMFFTTRGTAIDPYVSGNQTLTYSGMNDYENTDNAVLADTWTLSPKTVNALRAFYTQNRYILSNLHSNQFIQNLGSLMAPGGIVYAPSRFNLSGYVSESNAGIGPSDIDQMQFGGIDTVSMTRGRHEIKVGGSYVWSKYQETGANAAQGNFTFTGSVTGNTFADFLLGNANNLNQTNATFHRTHQYDPALFVQDDWQIAKRLNLNLGVRWEMFPPYTGDPGLGTFRANVQSVVIPTAPIGLLYQGDPGVPVGIYNTSLLNFAPRVGFAYDARGDGKTSLRGGFGIFFFMPSLNNNTGGQINPPFALSVSTAQTPSLVCPYGAVVNNVCTGDPFPYNPAMPNYQDPAAGTNIAAVPPNGGATPYVYEYNLTFEQQFSPHLAFHLGYVGNEQRKNYISIDENSPVYVPNAAITTAGLLARRPYEPYTTSTTASGFRYGQINIEDPVANGSYNSLQTTLRANYGRKFSMLASYVWSKALTFNNAIVDSYDLAMSYGPASSDLRHRFVVSYLYLLPETNRLGWFGREVLDGWHLNGVTSFQSGTPFTVTSGVDTNLDGTTNDRVNVIGNAYSSGQHLSRIEKIHAYINPAAFSIPCTGIAVCTNPYGNEQANQYYGPANVDTDLSLFKEFQLLENVRFQFRAEAFNVFGNVNLNNPKTALTNIQNSYNPNITTVAQSSGVQGEITGAGAPRRLQFAAKILF